MNKEIRQVVRWAKARGWSVERTKSSHFRVNREGHMSIVFGGTPSDNRAIHNFKARVRRAERAAAQKEHHG